MQSTFLAWISRMPLIQRWALMHSIRPENVAEHSHIVGAIAHLLCTISNEYYGTNLDANKATTIAVFHEISETKLQDLNSKTKYQTPEFTKQFKILEHIAEEECINTLPKELRKYYRNFIIQEEVDKEYKKIVKAADILSAFIKVKEELKYNNKEFEQVASTFETKVNELSQEMPAVKFFVEHFLNSCNCSLDELCGFDKQ